jgi:hypothetical protein
MVTAKCRVLWRETQGKCSWKGWSNKERTYDASFVAALLVNKWETSAGV